MFDRFDIVEAYYIYYRDFHNGQWSKEYKRLCHIKNYFTHKELSLNMTKLRIYFKLFY